MRFAKGHGALPLPDAGKSLYLIGNSASSTLANPWSLGNSDAPRTVMAGREFPVDDSTIVTDSVKRFKWVGTRPIRPDGVPKVTGKALYGGDYKLPGMLYGKILRSPHAHARIKSIDTSAAEKLTGVKAVITAKDLPDQKFEYIGPQRVAQNFWHITRNIMAREKALYEGHAIAAIAATSASIADEALRLIKVE